MAPDFGLGKTLLSSGFSHIKGTKVRGDQSNKRVQGIYSLDSKGSSYDRLRMANKIKYPCKRERSRFALSCITYIIYNRAEKSLFIYKIFSSPIPVLSDSTLNPRQPKEAL